MRILFILLFINQMSYTQNIEGTWESKKIREVIIFHGNEAIWTNITNELIWHKGHSFSYIRYELIEQKDTLIFQFYKTWDVSTNTGSTDSTTLHDTTQLKVYRKKGKIQIFSNGGVQEFEKTNQKIAIIGEPYRLPIDLHYKPQKDYYFGQSITKKPSFQPIFFAPSTKTRSPQ